MVEDAPFYGGDAPTYPSVDPRWPKMSPRWPKMAQDVPKMAPHGPKMGPRWPKMGSRWPKMGPKWAQDGPKMGLRWVNNRSQEAFHDGRRKMEGPRQRWNPLGVDFGAFLGGHMGLLWPSWAHLRAYLRHLKIKNAKCEK